MNEPLRIVILGLSITSSWGNGHATTYRGLVRELAARGHDVFFLERDVPWYARERDLPDPPYGRTALYGSVEELRDRFSSEVAEADAVIVGSYVPDGISIGNWVVDSARLAAFYDIDTPVTLAQLQRRECEYLSSQLIARYHLYLSFCGGPTLGRLQSEFGSPQARPLYCSVDPQAYYPREVETRWDLGYLGTYSDDRQPGLESLLLEPARRWQRGNFCVAGPLYPDAVQWPCNVQRIEHLPPAQHCTWYNAQRWTLNITRADMVAAGYSPSVRLFEAAACGTPLLSDAWEGIETFFRPGREIVLARGVEEALACLRDTPEDVRLEIAERARARVLAGHTAAHRAAELEHYLLEVPGQGARRKEKRVAMPGSMVAVRALTGAQ